MSWPRPGCKVIQVEEPTIHFTSAYTPEDRDTLEFLVEALNHEISGLEDCEVWIHTCWGNPMMQRVYDKTSYRDAIELYLDRVNCDVWTVEMKDRGGADLELFGNWRETLYKKIAIGAVSHRQLQVERPEEVAESIRNAARHIDLDKLIVSSDCGFGRQGLSRGHAFFKAAALAIGREYRPPRARSARDLRARRRREAGHGLRAGDVRRLVSGPARGERIRP